MIQDERLNSTSIFTKLVVILSPFIEEKNIGPLHMAYFLPHVPKNHNIFNSNKQVKQFLYRPGRAPRVTGIWASQNF